MIVAHAYCTLLTGNNALNGKDWYDIEPRDGITDVQPGQLNLPLNTPELTIYVPSVFGNSLHEKNFSYFRVLEFRIVEGEKILTYNVNDDPRYNTRMRLITQRESDAPTVDIKQGTYPDSLAATINDANLKSVWYTVDGGAKIPLMTEVLEQVTEKKIAIKMNLPIGTHTIKVGVDDYFRLVTEKSEQRNVVATGINDYTAAKCLMVYPNPTSNLTTISYPEGFSAHIRLYNASGSLLKHLVDDDQDGKTQLDVFNFPAGMIHFQINLESQEANRTLTGSIVIEK